MPIEADRVPGPRGRLSHLTGGIQRPYAGTVVHCWPGDGDPGDTHRRCTVCGSVIRTGDVYTGIRRRATCGTLPHSSPAPWPAYQEGHDDD